MSTKAVVWAGLNQAAVREVPIPKLRDGYILVKVTAVAINPTDYKKVDNPSLVDGCRLGSDYTGVVEEVGDKVDKPFKKGDRVTGMVFGGNVLHLDSGAFGNLIVAKAALQIKTPDNLSDTDAATLGVSMFTVGQGLYGTLGLPFPGSTTPSTPSDKFLLIHGASTATGLYGIQYAKLSGYTVITTSSPRNFAYLKSLGADATFDYSSPTAAAEIRAQTNDSLHLAWDCAGSGATLCAGALSTGGGKYAAILPPSKDEILAVNPKVNIPEMTLAYDVFGEAFQFQDKERPAKPEELEFGARFAELTAGLLAEGKLKAPRTVVNSGGQGLEGVLKGLWELKSKGISAGKLVYTL